MGNNISIFLCDRCGKDSFNLVDNGTRDIICAHCDVPMIDLQWSWTENPEEYVELELEDGTKYKLE